MKLTFNDSKNIARKCSKHNGTVMIIGENGVGRSHMAKWIHDNSKVTKGPFFSINVGALSHDKAETELFGIESKKTDKKGVLELANNGTLLIKEIESLDMALQSKLLSYLETKSILRIGGENFIKLNTRIIVSTHSDLTENVNSNKFLNDLLYRINVLPLTIPPLRFRQESISGLATEILTELTSELGLAHTPELSEESKFYLQKYRWPGNIRELRNILERTIMLGHNEKIIPEHIPLETACDSKWHYTIYFPENQTLHDLTKEVAKEIIEEAIRRSSTKKETAAMLGLSRHGLAHQLKALEINY